MSTPRSATATQRGIQDRQCVHVRLCSGLGNQLFQFTFGLACAQRWNADLTFDTTWFDLIARFHRPVRRFRLDAFVSPAPEAFVGGRRWLVGLTAALFDRTGRGRRLLERVGDMSVIQEKAPLRTQVLPAPAPGESLYLNGYWQTADHFLAVREELLRMLVPRFRLSPCAEEWISRVAQRRTGFLHVRRGDYASLVGEAGLLPLDYYRRAVRALEESGCKRHWLVFAEDEEWARRNMTFLPSWEVVAYDSPDRDIEDLRLMAACDAGVIANSSFSWWGAALGDRPGRVVVGPDRYWDRPGTETRDWLLPSWTAVPAWP